uniref:Uncharacterized protein n=1 Tax=Manihot esculenta TaxID=3983 RepID=A0A2C9U4X2_MANES
MRGAALEMEFLFGIDNDGAWFCDLGMKMGTLISCSIESLLEKEYPYVLP